MESNFPRLPIHTLEVIHQDGTFDLVNNYRQRKGVWFSRTG
jgi:hypothetical protein